MAGTKSKPSTRTPYLSSNYSFLSKPKSEIMDLTALILKRLIQYDNASSTSSDRMIMLALENDSLDEFCLRIVGVFLDVTS